MYNNPTFGVGTRVRVIRQRKYPEYKLLDLIGTVRTDSGANVSVVLDGITNPRSQYGCFYFKAVDLVEADEYDTEIKEESNMSAITNYLNIAQVRFVNDRKDGVYQYANFEGDLEVDDLCVVSTEDHRLVVAKVVKIVESNGIEMFREVVAKVCTDGYDSRVEWRAKAAELKSKMETRAKQLQDIALYQMLAKDDPDMADMLHEYQCIPQV